ncbi:Hydantoinase A [uncultured Alphaproteobacteria bacterium]|uniref:Hydantoinase A n=1 Tax=uncultured Alphaproteobacteria bacterium TaxID=91750 RepID=A0A212JI42_9PROT|nr:Hydantoinase A [uncultured Alphaproteobacteria bacterium]
MKRIGIDVGGTNTDAVLLDGETVAAAVKTGTTADVTGGVRKALADILAASSVPPAEIASVVIGTTHFVNAVVQRRALNRVAAIRISLPGAASLPPFCDWPADLRDLVAGGVHMIQGGFEFDGRPVAPLDEPAIAEAARAIAVSGVTAVGIASTFSPLNDACERRAAAIVADVCPGARITCSCDIGRIGLLERENATLLNAALGDLADNTVAAFTAALAESGIAAPLYITVNDGTVVQAAEARRFPVYSFASGPTNSIRGAAFLSKLDDGLVCDVGGTTTDVGCLVRGFPREANTVVAVGGVRTLFRMPDLMSIGIGGGTRVRRDPIAVGPDSVGFNLVRDALVFGGSELTLTDIAVAAGLADIGDAARVKRLPAALIKETLAIVHRGIADLADRMKTDARDIPLIAVGGGAMLIPEAVPGFSEILHVPHHAVANAVGAAITRISGEVDRIFRDMSRAEAIDAARTLATEKAVAAGADPASIEVVEMEDLPIAYLPGQAIRTRVRVSGEIAAPRRTAL